MAAVTYARIHLAEDWLIAPGTGGTVAQTGENSSGAAVSE